MIPFKNGLSTCDFMLQASTRLYGLSICNDTVFPLLVHTWIHAVNYERL
jgi:hypothetical protein